MATLDTNIALGIRPVQLENPMAQYSQIAQIQNARNQNALAQYQLSSAKREEDVTNALNNAYRDAYDPTTGNIDVNKLRQTLSTGGYGSKLPALEKTFAEMKEKQLQVDKLQGEVKAQPTKQAQEEAKLVDDKLKQARGFLDTIDPMDPNAPNLYIAWHEANHADPILGPVLAARGITADQSRARIQQAIQQGPQAFAQLLNQSKLGTEKFIELNRPTTQVVDQSGQKQVVQIPGLGGAPKTVGTYADVPLPPAVLAQKKDIARSGAANISNVQEKAEAADYGKLLVKDFESVKAQAAIASKSLPAIQSNLNILDKGFDTGFGTEAIAAGAKVLAALGVQNANKYATDAQTFLASANAAVLQKQLEQKGPQTEPDAQRITATGAQLGNTKEANKFLLNVAKAQLERDLKQREFYAAWREKNKTLEGAEDAWYAGPGSKSLFDNPALKRYGPSVVDQIPGQNRPAPAAAGNSVTLPDGRVKTFPNAAAANQFKKAAGL
jgi:hypothetical protein